MRRLVRRVIDHAQDSRLEKTLLLLLPFFIIVFFAAISAPVVLSFMSAGKTPGNVLFTPEPSEAAGIAQMTTQEQDEQYIESELTATPEPIIESSDSTTGWRDIAGNTYYYDSNGIAVTGLQTINGKLYFFDQYGVKAKALGVDVSSYNNFINWPAVAAQGIDYAIIRAGSRGWETGTIYDDSWFELNLTSAKAAGLKLGVYFYSTATTPLEAEDEALYVIECLNGTKLDLPIYIDVEYSGDYPNGRADKLSSERRSQIIDSFCTTVENNGYEAGVYSSQSYFMYNLSVDYLTQRYSIWLASYTRAAILPSFQWNYDIWQFTDNGKVNGITGTVDMNAWF
jgi:GH25 family lysozyme M1 (1,4-beta-N-acetylmuramidase)